LTQSDVFSRVYQGKTPDPGPMFSRGFSALGTLTQPDDTRFIVY
jgi:hypothetical protein